MKDPSTTGPRWILHPPLIAASFVLEIALANKIEPAGFARALAVAVLSGIGLTVVGWGITRDRWIGGLIAASLVLGIISILPVYFVWETLRTSFGSSVGLVALGLGLSAIIAIPTIQRAAVRRGAPLIRGRISVFLNRFAAVLVVVVLVFHVVPDLPGSAADAIRARETVSVAPVSELPDIYVILLDGYPRADVLERRFGIDNSPFLGDLERVGFDVATDSHSNYGFTQLTLASMFQMRYAQDVDALAPLVGTPGAHVNALRNATIDSPAFATLRAAGFEIVVTQPGYEHVALRGAADRVLEHGEMNDFERDVLKRTWLLDLLGALIPTIFTAPPRDRVIHAFDDVAQLASESRTAPIFTWVHVPAPHLPLFMNARGEALPRDPRRDANSPEGFGMTPEEFLSAYADELLYLNARVIGAVRSLAQAPGRPHPVILVMSDHGYVYDPLDVQASFANLFAAFTPEAPGLLKDAPTPVNLMPILFNRFLGTHLSLSPDRYFLSASDHRLLDLTEVPDPE